MLYEARVYTTVPGKLPAINDRFAKHTIGIFKNHGIGMLGFWTAEIGTSNQLTYILVFDSLADREKKWTAFQADPAWHQVRTETEAAGPIVDHVVNAFMRLTPYSPQPQLGSNIHELRTYDAMPGNCRPCTIGSPTTPYSSSRSTAFNVAYWPRTWAQNRRVYAWVS